MPENWDDMTDVSRSGRIADMAATKLRTIKTRRRNTTLKRSDVTKAVIYAMSLRGAVPTPQKPPRKRAAGSRK